MRGCVMGDLKQYTIYLLNNLAKKNCDAMGQENC